MSYKVKNHIKTFRFHANDMSQEQLALAVGVSRQTINAIEKEKYSPSLELAFKIAQVFEVKLDEVFYFEKIEK